MITALIFILFSFSSIAQETAPQDTSPAVAEIETRVEYVNELRKREHHLMLSYDSAKIEVEVAGDKGSAKSSAMSVQYGYEFGHWQPWIEVSATLSENGSGDTTATSTLGGIRFNFIKNQPKNDLIPYASLGAGYLNEDIDFQGEKFNTQGSIGYFAFGLSWFPLGELVAIDLSYGAVAGDLRMASTTSTDRPEAEYSSTGLKIAYTLVF